MGCRNWKDSRLCRPKHPTIRCWPSFLRSCSQEAKCLGSTRRQESRSCYYSLESSDNKGWGMEMPVALRRRRDTSLLRPEAFMARKGTLLKLRKLALALFLLLAAALMGSAPAP